MNKETIFSKFSKTLRKHPVAAVFIAICILAPIVVTSKYWQRLLVEIFFFGALACAWNIIGGYARQTSWAHAAFFAVGGYSGVLMFTSLGISPWIGMLVGCALSAILAVIVGMPTFKLRGVYFAIATIACCSIVERLLLYFKDFTGGAKGVVLPSSQNYSLFTLNFKNELPYYYIALILMLLAVFICWLIEHTRMGFYLKAIRDDEDAAESLGIHTYRIKLIAFIVSAVITAVTGTIYVFHLRYIEPASVATHDVAVKIGMTAIIGGLGTTWGPVMGAVLTVVVLQLANSYFGSIGGGGLAWIIYGAVIILFVLFQPGGLIVLVNKILKRIKTKINTKTEIPVDEGLSKIK